MEFNSSHSFFNDLYALNDSEEFGVSYKDIYPPELKLKLEHHDNQAIFSDLDNNLIEA